MNPHSTCVPTDFKSGASTDSAMPPKGSQLKAEVCFNVTFGKIGVFQETLDALRVPKLQIERLRPSPYINGLTYQ